MHQRFIEEGINGCILCTYKEQQFNTLILLTTKETLVFLITLG